jgi:hypothetical protein
MHPLPPAHLCLRPSHNDAQPIPYRKTISRSRPRRPVILEMDNHACAPPIYWRAVALTGAVCFTLMCAGIVLALGSGKRPPAPIEERVDEAPSPGSVDRDASDSSVMVNAPMADDANVAPISAPNLAAASMPLVAATPSNPEPLDPFADASGDNPALAHYITLAKAPPACKRYGTAVDFVDNPIDAAAQALRERKLLFVLHVAGNFEEKKFT